MTISANFKTIAGILGASRNFDGDTYALLTLAEQLETALFPAEPVSLLRADGEYTHGALVQVALADSEVMEWMRDGKKIHAIKRLRTITGQGLKATKDAVEDHLVIRESGYTQPSW